MDVRKIERRLIIGSRYSAMAAVLGSLAGAVLMFFVGLMSLYKAGEAWLRWPVSSEAAATAVINVIEGLDRFLIALVMLYFGYGVHSLFIRTDQSLESQEFGLPEALRVRHIGQLKQVVAEVIIVVLFVLFLRHSLIVFQAQPVLSWQQLATLLVLPVCAALLGVALKLAELHPKPIRPAAILTSGTDATVQASETETKIYTSKSEEQNG